MRERLKKILSTTTARQSVVTTVSTVINGLLGALFYFFTAKWLGPAGFGLFSLGAAIIGTVSDILDFGSQQGIVRFVSRYRDTPTMWSVAKLGLVLKSFSGLLGLLLLVLFSPVITVQILHRPEIQNLLPYLGLGVLFQLLFSFSTALAQGQERFYLWGGLFVGTNLFRFVVLTVLYLTGYLSANSVVLLYILIPLTGFAVSLPFYHRNFFSSSQIFDHLGEFIHFNKWIAGFVVIAALNSRLDTFLLARYLSLSQIGIYAMAGQIVAILPQLTVAIGAVMAPKFASFTSHADNFRYVKKASYLTSGSSLIGMLALVPAGALVLYLSGSQFMGGLTPLLILLLAMAVFMATAPLRDSIIYYFARPDVFFWSSLIQMFITVTGGMVLIPRYQLIGAAASVLISHIVLAVISLLSFKKLHASHG